jgi:hypothetical protein
MEAFLDRWHASDPEGKDHLSRAAVFRWVNGQLPKSSEKLLKLSAVLDIDPFALLSPGKASFRDAADRLLEIVQPGRSVPAALQFVRPYFGRRQTWFPGIAGTDGRPRSWHIREFEPDPFVRTNVYAMFALAPLSSNSCRLGVGPRVFISLFGIPEYLLAVGFSMAQ